MQYQCPEWFRDAKFGIWSHWGPVAAPGGFGGNWYARQMYVPGTREYEHHVKTCGHPSVFGYKDIIELWKAEKFDPDRLMGLYVKAGAKYFVSMGAHHVEGVAVQDEEHSVLSGIKDQPWQTDSSIATWFFVPDLEPRWRRTAPDVIAMLVDIVAKNGNLLLNIPQRGDGTIDTEAEQLLAELAAWMKVNGEAIFATRPWKIFGEGPAMSVKGHGNGIRRATDYTAEDIRFTRSKDGATLYAIALGWPEGGKLLVRSLAKAAGQIGEVSLLGHSSKFDWQQSTGGLEATLPDKKPCAVAYVLKIAAGDLQPVPVVEDNVLETGVNGRILLPAAKARIHGNSPKYEHSGAKDQIGYWNGAADFVSWNIVTKPGTYAVEIAYSCTTSGSEFTVEVGGQKLPGTSTSTGSWSEYRTDKLGTVNFDKPGSYELFVKPKADPKWRSIGLKSVVLEPTAKE